MLSWWRNAGAMGGEQDESPLRWDAEGSQVSPSAGPTTRWASQGHQVGDGGSESCLKMAVGV